MSDDIDPDRKFSNGTDWDNSIDWDDASDGSDGGYDRHGSPINANAMKELVQLRMETSRLRAELAAVTAERDRMREALRPFADEFRLYKTDFPDHFYISDLGFTFGQLRAAAAALEGVTEPASPWREIESAPKDGTWIFIYRDNWHGAIKAKWGEIDGVDSPFMAWVFQDEFLCIGCAEGCLGYNEDIEDGYMPTHWMPLPDPPR